MQAEIGNVTNVGGWGMADERKAARGRGTASLARALGGGGARGLKRHEQI